MAPRAGELEEAGIESSAREREAMKIERSADDVCLAFLLEAAIEQAGGDDPPVFEGEIVGLIGKGAFVRFGEQGFEGLLPARRLRDWYELNEEGTALIGEDSGRALRLGDPIAGGRRSASTPRAGAWTCYRRPKLIAMAKKGGKRKAAAGDVATNRQASYRFNLLEKWECGVELMGSEVKSIRQGGVQIKDGYAMLEDGEVWLHNVHIAPYGPAARDGHEPERPRKLLLHRREIDRLSGSTHEKGLTLVPTRIYFKGSRAKVEIALARGKDARDKRASLKAKDQRREIDRALAEHGR